MFCIIKIENGKASEPITGEDGKPVLFDNGAEAASWALGLSTGGVKHQPRPFAGDSDWRERERVRFVLGAYRRLPWYGLCWFSPESARQDWLEKRVVSEGFGEGIPDHYAHVSTESPGMIAYTESPEKGAADRQTRVRPGRYLEQFFSSVLDSDTIRDMATQFAAEFGGKIELRFADTADDIERVYRNGPSSCMSYSADNYSSPFHPVRVYAAGDLAVAYLEIEERITARCISWPAKKVYGRIYGDEERIKRALDLAGYRHGATRDFYGARLIRHEYDGCFVAPYVDVASYADDCGDYLRLADCGDVELQNTNGLSENNEDRVTCEMCEARVDGTESVRVGRHSWVEWCENCRDNNTFYCERTGDTWSDEHEVRLETGEAVSQYWFESHGFTCEGNGDNYLNDDLVTLEDGTKWSQDYFQHHGFTDPDNGDNYSTEDGVTDEETDEVVCEATLDARRAARGEPELVLAVA